MTGATSVEFTAPESEPEGVLTSETTNDPRRWFALAVLAAGLSMIVLDGTIVGVALPRIVDVLHLDLTDAQWVNSLYSMVFAALLLFFGRIGDRLGRRTLFVVGVAIFVLGSVAAAISGGAGTLIAARAVQGLGGAMVLPSTLATVNATFRGRDRATAFGVWGAVMAGMAAIGPLLGGWLTTSFDWRWIFLVNVPIGVLVILGTLRWVPATKSVVSARGLDVDGLLTSGIGLALIVFGLIEGSRLGWWRPMTDFLALGSPGPEPPPSPSCRSPWSRGSSFWARSSCGSGTGHGSAAMRSSSSPSSQSRPSRGATSPQPRSRPVSSPSSSSCRSTSSTSSA